MVCTRVDIHAFYAYVLHTIIKAIPYLERPKTKTKTTNKQKKKQKNQETHNQNGEGHKRKHKFLCYHIFRIVM